LRGYAAARTPLKCTESLTPPNPLSRREGETDILFNFEFRILKVDVLIG
jgi:hypothetical protein